MEVWKTAIERKSKTNAKWKKKVAVFVRVKGMWQVFGFEQEKRSSMGYYFGNCEKKNSGHDNRNFVTQGILFKSITKN